MSVLSNTAIKSAILGRRLYVSPILDIDQIGACSIDLRMGTVALTPRARGISHVDPIEMPAEDLSKGYIRERRRRQKLERHDIPFREYFLLHPGMLTLTPTLEWVKLPKNLMGVVTARSSWAREGLNIATASFINPNYEGIITLELANLGQVPIKLYPGLRIAQIAFYETESDVVEADSNSQFNLSFEPMAGKLSAGDSCFFPQLPAHA